MERALKRTSLTIIFSFSLLIGFTGTGSSQDYEALKGVKSVKTVFDFRDGIPGNALVHARLIHETYKDDAIRRVTAKPHFVVIFMGSSVKLLSHNREGFSDKEKKVLTEIDDVIAGMAKDGIAVEVCMSAVNFFNIKPESISAELKRVPNGWISSIGYQERAYSLVPVF